MNIVEDLNRTDRRKLTLMIQRAEAELQQSCALTDSGLTNSIVDSTLFCNELKMMERGFVVYVI